MESTRSTSSPLSTARDQERGAVASAAGSARDTLVSSLTRPPSSSIVRIADLISLSVALFVTAFSTSLDAGQSLGDYLGMRISVRNLVLGVALLATWRLIFWATGMYHTRLNRRTSTFLWRVP